MEFLATKVNFFPVARDSPAGGCLDHWPPTFSPRLLSPQQLKVSKGANVAVTFFFRVNRLGDWSFNGLVIVFEARELLRLWLRGQTLRGIERLSRVVRKTVRRYVEAPTGRWQPGAEGHEDAGAPAAGDLK